MDRAEAKAHVEKYIKDYKTDEIDDIPELDKILRHELSHILESPFQLFYDAVIEFVPGDEMKNALASIWFKAKELTVKNIERMHEGHRGYEFKDFE